MLHLVLIVLGTWTLLSFAVAVVFGAGLRRLQPIPVPTARRPHLRIVKNSEF